MFSRNAVLSIALSIIACSACASVATTTTTSTSTSMPKGAKLSRKQVALQAIDARLKTLEQAQKVCKARIYEASDEAMEHEFQDWMDYEGDLSEQEAEEACLKRINAEIAHLQKKKKKLLGS